MGFFDFLPCCGKRDTTPKNDAVDTDPLLLPRGPGSVTSQEGYGTLSMSANPEATTHGGLTGEQRARIAEIGREAGNHMLPINQASRAATTSPIHRHRTHSSTASPASRSDSPLPALPRVASGLTNEIVAGEQDTDGDGEESVSTDMTGSGVLPAGTSPATVHKSLFGGDVPNRGPRGGKSRGGKGGRGARGRGRGRSKKQK